MKGRRKKQQSKFEKGVVHRRGQWKGRGRHGKEKRQERHKSAVANRMHRRIKRVKKLGNVKGARNVTNVSKGLKSSKEVGYISYISKTPKELMDVSKKGVTWWKGRRSEKKIRRRKKIGLIKTDVSGK